MISLFKMVLLLLLAGGAATFFLWLLATLVWTVVLRKVLAILVAVASAGVAQLAVYILAAPCGPIAADHFFTQAGVFVAVWPVATLILMNVVGCAFARCLSRFRKRNEPVAVFGWTGALVWTLRQVRLEQDAAYVPPQIEGFLQEAN